MPKTGTPASNSAGVDLRGARLVDAGRAAGQDDRGRVLGQHLGDRHRVRHDLGVDLRLAHPAGDQLGVLGSEVHHEDRARRAHVRKAYRQSHPPPGTGRRPGASAPAVSAARRAARRGRPPGPPGAAAAPRATRGTATRAAARVRHRPCSASSDIARSACAVIVSDGFTPEVRRDRRAVDHVQPRVAVHPVLRVDHPVGRAGADHRPAEDVRGHRDVERLGQRAARGAADLLGEQPGRLRCRPGSRSGSARRGPGR